MFICVFVASLVSYKALTFFPPLLILYLAGLPALVVAVSVGFTKAKGYGTVN